MNAISPAGQAFCHPLREGESPAGRQESVNPERLPTILVLDSLDINRRLLRAMLKAAPYRLIEARRASEALAILDQEPVDLLILDLMMPEMSGADFCKAMKSSKKTQFTPVLMLMRQATPAGVPLWQPVVGLVGVCVFTALILFAGSRIFRVGLLMQGKPPQLREMLRWAWRG